MFPFDSEVRKGGAARSCELRESAHQLAYLQAATRIRYAQGFYFAYPIFLEELKVGAPASSDTRVSEVSRPVQENRHSDYSRPARYRR